MYIHSKEVNINFRIKTRGLFEIIEPVLEEGEVFDSSLLKETVNSLISTGKRNFAFDLSILDYIYSDTINVLMALNKRTLDVSGRLALLAPQPEVLEILRRAGIHNILRIFESEAELIKTSEDIILQTTSIKMADIKSIADQIQPQSEFDQLRDEIGSVFGGSSVSESPVAAKPVPQKPKAPKSPSIPAYDQSYQNFGNSTDGGYNAVQPEQPQFDPPPAVPRKPPTYSAPQTPQFQNRQFTPPSPRPSAPRPMQPPVAPVQPRSVEPPPMVPPRSRAPEVPKTPDYSFQQETQRFNTAPVSPVKSPRQQEPPPEINLEEDLEEFSSSKKKGLKPVQLSNDKFDDDDFDDVDVKKRSPVPIFLLVALFIILGGVGAFIAINKFSNKSEDSEKVTSAPATTASQQPAVPQLPVEQPTGTATTQPQAAVPEKPAQTQSTQPTQTAKPVAEPVVEKKPVIEKKPAIEKRVGRQKYQSRVREAVKPPQQSKPAGKNMLVITSIPAGAAVNVNGEQMGTTPYTWKEPVFGMISIKISKQGYADNMKSVEFTGGTMRESFKLEKETLPPPPPKAPIVKTEFPKSEPTSISSDEFDTPKPSRSESTPEVVSEPAPAPAPAPAPVISSAGGDASIFIASIPPVADVYLDGKLIGKTNITELKMPSGSHSLRFVKGPKEITKEITLQPGKNPSQMVKLP